LFKGEIEAHKDKGWQRAKHLELLPPDSFGQGLTIDDDEHLDEIAGSDLKRARMEADPRR